MNSLNEDSGIIKKRLERNITIALNLEWLGVRFEETKYERDDLSFTSKTVYYYSVPESSVIELDNKDLNIRIKTADGLKLLAKELITEMFVNSCRAAYPDDKEFVDDVKDHISEYMKCKARVRHGEVWNREMGDNRLQELRKNMRAASQYAEV